MKNNIDFFYRISKEAGLAEDEDGNSAECYLNLGFTLKNPASDETIEGMKGEALKAAADFLGIDVSFVTIVTEEEYIAETEEG